MSEQIYKDFFEEALNQIHEEYIASGKEDYFKVWFNLGYVEDTLDSITVSIPSESMWRLMKKNGSAEKIQQKIDELAGQKITLIPAAKNAVQSSISQQTQVQQLQQTEQKSDAPIGELFSSSDFQSNDFKSEYESNKVSENISNKERFDNANDWLTQEIERRKKLESNESNLNIQEETPENQFQNQQLSQQSIEQLYSGYDAEYQNYIAQALQQMNDKKDSSGYDDEYQKYLTDEVQKRNAKATITNHPLLRDDYTFENFIPGANSQYAYHASQRAAENPGREYNPMLIYGGVGLGKTHLMQAIGNYIYAHNNDARICYISAESFTNEFTYSIQNKTTDKFKKKYRSLDVLLLDDIQFFEGKEATQEELFHTFNEIYDRKGQLVFTCDRPITEIKGITDRLRTRFSRGLNIDLQPPDYETRRAILEQKMNSQGSGKKIPSDVIDYIAQNIQSNVRDLEACLMKMIGYCDLVGQTLTLDIARELLKDKIDESAPTGAVTVEAIQQAVAKYYGIKQADIVGKKKNKQYVLPRQIAIYITRDMLREYSLKDIGYEFGGRDHTTILSAIEKITTQIKINPTIDSVIKQLKKDAHDFI